tara:strand:- start:2123 stop:2656 length:534 start_codon:yes stop_codon:yes gene_type:complete
MARLMNVNESMAMDTEPTGQEGSVTRTFFKHVGELADESKAKVVIVYRTVPGEPNNCLVVGTKFLPDVYHNALMRAVESQGGQAEFELGSYLGRQSFPDGTNMLSVLHNDGYLKKFSTKEITVTYGATPEGKIALNKLNEQIAKERGVSVAELTVADDSEATEKKETKKSDAKKSKK